jgi:hypothetical protein
MTRLRSRAWVARGFALGAVVAVWNLARARSTPAPASPALAARDAAGVEVRPGCKDDAEVAWRAARVQAMGKDVDALFLANTQAHFRPPKDLPPRFGGKAIEETLHQSILAAGVHAEILGTDCREYPCVTMARTRSAEDLQKIKDQFFDQPAYASDMKQLSRARSDTAREYRFAATVYQSTDPRQAEIFAAYTRRLGVARLGPGSLRPGANPFPPDTIGSDRAVAAAPLSTD